VAQRKPSYAGTRVLALKAFVEVDLISIVRMTQKSSALITLWHGLQGTWQLKRSLHSMTAAHPSGDCNGTASFTVRQPAVFIDGEGKLQNASKEMLYSEQGDFQLTSTDGMTNLPKFSFSRKYVWRLQDEDSVAPQISIWFVKPGTDQIDYLFHKVVLQDVTDGEKLDKSSIVVECNGGHLCVEDYYSSTYTFQLVKTPTTMSDDLALASWTMLHEVRGPKKDQIVETKFSSFP